MVSFSLVASHPKDCGVTVSQVSPAMGGKYMVAGTCGVIGAKVELSLLQEENRIQDNAAANIGFIIQVEYFRQKENAEV